MRSVGGATIQLMLQFIKAPFLVLDFPCCALVTFQMMLSINVAIYADTTLCSKFDQASDLWQQLESASELASDLQDNIDLRRKWLVDFSAGKTQLVLFVWSNDCVAADVKLDGSIL